jgi:PAS domain S-box-containing protein
MIEEMGKKNHKAGKSTEKSEANTPSDELFRLMIEDAAVGIFQCALDGRLMMVNSEMARLFGYDSAGEMMSMVAGDAVHKLYVNPDDFTQFRLLVSLQGRINHFDVLNFRKDGNQFWVRMNARAVMDADEQKVISFHVFLSDVTDQKQAEFWLQQQNEYLIALQETTLDLSSQLDLNVLFEHIVKRAGALLGTSSGYLDLIDPESMQLVPCIGLGLLVESLNHCAKPGEGVAGKVCQTGRPIVVADYDHWAGRIKTFSQNTIGSILGVPLLSGTRVMGVLGLAYEKGSNRVFKQDAVDLLTQFARFVVIAIENVRLYSMAQQELAERKQAEAALSKWAHIFEHAEWGIFVSMTDALTLDLMNPALARMHGDSVTELVGRPITDLFAPEQRSDILGLIKLAYQNGHLAFETTNLRKDGSQFPAIIDITVVKDENGEVLYRAVNVQDITDYQQIQQELSRLNAELEQRVLQRTKQLEESNQELEAFAYSISHDLRAPLRIINGYSNILLEDFSANFPVEARDYILRMDLNTKWMGKLIDDLLAFSRVGRKVLERRKVYPVDMINQVYEELESERRNRKVDLLVMDLPVCFVDPDLFKMVFANLISNAMKFTRNRNTAQIEIGFLPCPSLSEKIQTQLGERCPGVYYIKDNGVGFDMQYAEKLFGVFQRLHPIAEFEGTGVGLANVQRIIQRHGGYVWAEAEVNQGATFFFSLEGMESV